MKIYRVTVSHHGTYGPRGLTQAATGTTIWAFTDKAQAVKVYKSELKAAVKNNHRATLRLQLLATPHHMTTELWINSIVNSEVPYKITETISRERITPVKLVI